MAAPHEGKSAEMIPPPANNGVCEAPQQPGDWSKWINMGGFKMEIIKEEVITTGLSLSGN